jgi:hypothetical protein
MGPWQEEKGWLCNKLQSGADSPNVSAVNLQAHLLVQNHHYSPALKTTLVNIS